MKNVKFAIKTVQNIAVLHLEDQPVMCAYRTPFITPNRITGHPDVNLPVCGNNCQFFEVVPLAPEDNPGTIKQLAVNLYCNGSECGRQLIVLDQLQTPFDILLKQEL